MVEHIRGTPSAMSHHSVSEHNRVRSMLRESAVNGNLFNLFFLTSVFYFKNIYQNVLNPNWYRVVFLFRDTGF